jgi:hypothetical protein
MANIHGLRTGQLPLANPLHVPCSERARHTVDCAGREKIKLEIGAWGSRDNASELRRISVQQSSFASLSWFQCKILCATSSWTEGGSITKLLMSSSGKSCFSEESFQIC